MLNRSTIKDMNKNKKEEEHKKNIFSILNDPKMPVYMFYKNYNYLISDFNKLYTNKFENKENTFWNQDLIPLNKFNLEGSKKEFEKLKDKLPENIKNNLQKFDIKHYMKRKRYGIHKNIKTKNDVDILEKEILPINNLDVKLNIKFKSEKEKFRDFNKIPNHQFLKPIKFVENDQDLFEYYDFHNYLNKNLFKRENIKLIKLFHKISKKNFQESSNKDLYNKSKIEFLLKERYNAFNDYKLRLKKIKTQATHKKNSTKFNTKSQNLFTQTIKNKSDYNLLNRKKTFKNLNIDIEKKMDVIFKKSEVKTFSSFLNNWLRFIEIEDVSKDANNKKKLEALPNAYIKYHKINPNNNFYFNFKKKYQNPFKLENNFKIKSKVIKDNFDGYLKNKGYTK